MTHYGYDDYHGYDGNATANKRFAKALATLKSVSHCFIAPKESSCKHEADESKPLLHCGKCGLYFRREQ